MPGANWVQPLLAPASRVGHVTARRLHFGSNVNVHVCNHGLASNRSVILYRYTMLYGAGGVGLITDLWPARARREAGGGEDGAGGRDKRGAHEARVYSRTHARRLRVVLSTGGGSCCSPSSAQGAPSLDAHPCESHRALVHLRRRSGPYGDGLEGYCPTHHHLAGRPPTRIVVFL